MNKGPFKNDVTRAGGEGGPKKVQKTVTSIVQNSKFYCLDGDKGGGGSKNSVFCDDVIFEWPHRYRYLNASFLYSRWIKPGTTIISDCWKAYDTIPVLQECDYEHLKVNHSVEFVNSEGDHTNKIEGHWRVAKAPLPKYGRRKYHMSSYLAEFMWRYERKGTDLFLAMLDAISKVEFLPVIE